MADYNFSDYLSEVPDYESTTTLAERIAQAKAASDLAYDPVRQEQERQRRYNEMTNYNAQNKLNASQTGIDKTLQYNASQAKKANAINAAARGGGNSDGLSAYLNNQTDTALAGQKLNIAAGLATDKFNQDQNYQQQDRESQQTLNNIETQRGNAAEVYLTNMNNAEAERENTWKMNALNVANAIGSGEMTAEDINARLQMAADSISNQKYAADQQLAWDKYQFNNIGALDTAKLKLQATELFGEKAGGSNNNVSLGIYASSLANAPAVTGDENSIQVNGKTYTSDTLQSAYKALYDPVSNRWVLSQSNANTLLGLI